MYGRGCEAEQWNCKSGCVEESGVGWGTIGLRAASGMEDEGGVDCCM